MHSMHVKPGSQYDAGAASVTSVTEKSLFFTSQIASLTSIFSTIWLVGHWLTLTTLCWNRNGVYSSVTPTLATLRWREHHIVNQALVCYLELYGFNYWIPIFVLMYAKTVAHPKMCLLVYFSFLYPVGLGAMQGEDRKRKVSCAANYLCWELLTGYYLTVACYQFSLEHDN